MKLRNVSIVIFLLSLASCEKVIYVDLSTTNPKIVVEGNLTDMPGLYTVVLSRTVNFYDPNVFPPVTGAKVIISDNVGNSESLTEVSPGNYQTKTLQGIEGRSYTLDIVDNGNEYKATSTMPSRIPIDSVNFELNNRGDSYRVICKFSDPVGIFNYYKLQIGSNDTVGLDTTDVRILADGFADGQELTITYRTHLSLGDTVYVNLECIDKATYDFWRTLPNVEGGIRQYVSAPPANPVNNISNGGLGYFAAYAVSRDTAIVH